MRVTIAFYHDNAYTNAVEYAFNVLSSSLDCNIGTDSQLGTPGNQNVILVSYGRDVPSSAHENHLHISADLSFWDNFGKPESLPRLPLYRCGLQELQLTPNTNLEDPLICPFLHENKNSQRVYW